ncbi:MAG: MaoC/PaaZ C-terminal domain-containing protein [Paracoccaceae bacterium]
MPLDPGKLKARHFAPVEQTYTHRDALLYALGLGFGADPMDEDQLRFVFEEAEGFAAVPTMPAGPGFWAREPDSGVTWQKVLHGEQGLEIHAPLPTAATVVGRTRIEDVIDKGEGCGALIRLVREIEEKGTGRRLATARTTTFARADGGFGGPSGPSAPARGPPERAPDAAVDIPTRPEAALIYRLSGDPNPLHASPAVAREAGFERPILHGLCSYGVAGRAILQACCAGDPARLRRLDVRFSSPVHPGETIRTEIWRDGGEISFRARVVERDAVVLNNGYAVVG